MLYLEDDFANTRLARQCQLIGAGTDSRQQKGAENQNLKPGTILNSTLVNWVELSEGV